MANFSGSDIDDLSDSDEDYNENEKILLNKVRNKTFKDSDSETEVLGVGAPDDESDLALSDVEGQAEDDNLPDIRAWGKNRRQFYSTDYVDQDYGGFQGKDAHLAELEEEEARNLQQQLAQQLDDEDFRLDIGIAKKIEEDKMPEELIKSDISKLSKRQQMQILQKEAPEFFGLVEDFENHMVIARDVLSPILEKYKNGELEYSSGIEFVQTQHNLILNYCTNIQMYLLLKASKVSVNNHPIIKRLYQYRQLLAQLNPIFEEKIKPHVDKIMEGKINVKKSVKPLKLLSKMNKKTKSQKEVKKVKFNENVIEHKDSDEDEEMVEDENEDQNTNEIGKRAITYQMSKNKGLTPHRKKEQRNPRVKHRNKFRKAKIRRRGAVREARTEMKRYGGEISGIKASVSKSIKIKS